VGGPWKEAAPAVLVGGGYGTAPLIPLANALLAAGSPIEMVLGAATGLVVIDGYADRSGLLTIRDWSSVPPGGSAEFDFVPLGTFSAATLTATVSPGFW